MQQLRIAEIFTSIQGEGIWTGTPSMFIRVSGCNLRCDWCDTPYASWEPEGPMEPITNLLAAAASSPVRHVVITGGEPMLFDAVVPLTVGLRELGKTITVETAGTVFRELECDLLSISPKLSNSAPNAGRIEPNWIARHETTRRNLQPLHQLVCSYNFQLKFVVNPEIPGDLEEIESILSQLPMEARTHTLVMAEGKSPKILHAREKLLVDACIERGWRLTPRFHIDLFGDTRGT